jgi:hypothetical protein
MWVTATEIKPDIEMLTREKTAPNILLITDFSEENY